jgi:hypothetical protein
MKESEYLVLASAFPLLDDDIESELDCCFSLTCVHERQLDNECVLSLLRSHSFGVSLNSVVRRWSRKFVDVAQTSLRSGSE